jgi:hypothetical protein
MSGALCRGLCVGVRKHLISVNYRTNAWVDWSDFSVANWWWLEEGSFWWSAPPLIQAGHYGCHLGFGFRQLQDKCLGRLIRFLCGLLGLSRGSFLSMISSTTHPRWPLQLPSWISSSIRGQMPGSIIPIFLWLIGGHWRKVPFNDHLRHSSKMAAMPPSWIWALLIFWPTPGSIVLIILVAHWV